MKPIRKFIRFFKDFYRCLKRSCKYFRFMWDNYNFDWGYLLDLEAEKLKDMLKYFEKSDITDNTWTVRDIKLALKMIDIISDKDTSFDMNKPTFLEDGTICESHFESTKYVNISNMRRFLDKSLIKSFNYNKRNQAIIIKDELRKEKAWNIYCEITRDRMRTWWD